MLGKNCKTPDYIRALNLHNKITNSFEAKCKFQSGEEEKYTINQNDEFKIEKTINKGSFSVVDPIENLTLTLISNENNNNNNNSVKEIIFEPKGVQILTYEISYNETEGISLKKI